MNQFISLIATAAITYSLLTTSLNAEPVSAEILRANHESCMTTSEAGLKSFAEPYCTCITDRLSEDFTLEQYLQLTAEILEAASKTGGDIGAAGSQFPRIQALASLCLQQITSKK